MRSINTVNVILQVGVSVQKLASFPDNHEGNVVAEAVFADWVQKEIGEVPDEDLLSDALDNGIWEANESQIIICHSCDDGLEVDRCGICGFPMKSEMRDTDGTNIEEISVCSNKDCPSNQETGDVA